MFNEVTRAAYFKTVYIINSSKTSLKILVVHNDFAEEGIYVAL